MLISTCDDAECWSELPNLVCDRVVPFDLRELSEILLRKLRRRSGCFLMRKLRVGKQATIVAIPDSS